MNVSAILGFCLTPLIEKVVMVIKHIEMTILYMFITLVIDKCTNVTDLMNTTVYSTNGSYVCDCQLDYQLSNELNCSDINEYNTTWL